MNDDAAIRTDALGRVYKLRNAKKGEPNKLVALKEFWNSFRTAAWLGWQIESNWTDPFLFAIYSFIKPISGAAILVVMRFSWFEHQARERGLLGIFTNY